LRARPDRILDYREYPVLYVDDEPERRRIFELTFRREFKVLTASCGEEALERIHGTPIALVLSDQRMPGMPAVELLARAHAVDPRTVRMLLTASGDPETLGGAIDHGTVSRLVPGSWAPDAMRDTLRRGIEHYAIDRERDQLLRELTLLTRVAKSLTQELAFSPLIDLILATAIEDLGYDAAALLLFDRGGERLVWERFAPREDGVSEALRGIELSPHTAPAFLRRLCDGEAQLLALDQALALEGAMRRWVTEVAAEEILVVPLLGRERPLGALTLDNRRGGRRFSIDDHTLLEGLAGQAAIAIENARVVEGLRRSQEELRRGAGLDALGSLAAGLAHEINNPLVSIHTFLQLAQEKRGESDAAFWGDYRDLACRDLDRIRDLVADLQRLHPEAGAEERRELLDPGELARELAARHLEEASRVEVVLRVDEEPGAAKIFAARAPLQRALGQLVHRALGAAPACGEVAIRVGPDAASGGVLLEIRGRDDGKPGELLEGVFEPLLARGAERAPGLGLLLCQRVVSDHGGCIELRAHEGEDTALCVRLPAASSPASATGARDASLDPPTRNR